MASPSLPFRKQYARIARKALRERRLSWLASTALKAMAVPLSERLGRPLAGPLMGILIPTYRCNNACFMCDLPKPRFYEKRGDREFDTSELEEVIDDMASIGVAGLTLTGGEATVRKDCFELLAHARRRGLFVHLNTNGYNLANGSNRIDELLDSDLDAMNISLDGALAETHNRLRGAAFGFERVEKVTREILEKRTAGRPGDTYTFVVGPENCREIPRFVDMARRRGVDSVSFIPLAGCYDGAVPADQDGLRAMDEAIDWLREEKARSADSDFIDNSDAYLSLFPRAFRSTPSPLRCYVGYHNVMVDCYGNVYPCALHYELHRPLGSIVDTPLRRLWYEESYEQSRRALTSCTDCYWNCHTEINLLYQSPPAPVA